ncbi:hypothetical protein [Bradyrhizobium monzae]|uniref:hypothetical protein n=1 Tax=Bradyrhizobium sp. Oc8 TaxID=2876780 RepID=UPI001F2EF0B1|nr:hypothetical protein [Bradyrhizobium sp. Oc8]
MSDRPRGFSRAVQVRMAPGRSWYKGYEEPQILQALREVEAGNERLGTLMSRLVDEGAEFEGLMNSAQGLSA